MHIGIIGSMQFTEKMLEARDRLIELGHDAFVTDLHKALVGKTDEEKEIIKIHQKNNMDAIREFWNAMQRADAVLVLNLDKHGIKNYVSNFTPQLCCGWVFITSAAIRLWKSGLPMF